MTDDHLTPRWAPWFFLAASALFFAGYLWTDDPVAAFASAGMLGVSWAAKWSIKDGKKNE